MNIINLLPVLISLYLFISIPLFAQLDSLQEPDSSGINPAQEQLLEQNTQADESPLLEFLQSENKNQAGIRIRSRVRSQLEDASGYTDGYYLGSPIQSYQRIMLNDGTHFSAGVLAQKDPGEIRVNDFITGNIMLSNIGFLSKLIVGDYFLESGQGVAFWRSIDVTKGPNVVFPVNRNERGLLPYSYSGESGFLRGIAGEFRVAGSTVSLMYSDAPENSYLDGEGRVTGFYTSGYFNTVSSLEKKDDVSEQLVGARVRLPVSNNAVVGLTGYRASFSRTLFLEDGVIVDGTNFSMGTINYQVKMSNTSFFGEWGRSNGEFGGTSGLLIDPERSVTIVAEVRNYPHRFLSLHGLAFGEGSFNESGAYFGIVLRPHDHFKISAYDDLFSFPKSASKLFGSTGNDFLIQTEFLPVRKFGISIRYQRKAAEEREDITTPAGLTGSITDQKFTQLLRFNIEYQLSANAHLRGRIDETFLNYASSSAQERGMLEYQDIGVHCAPPLWMNFRLIYFSTDSYYSRVYELERDLPGVSSMPALYGEGVKWYVLLKYSFHTTFDLNVKYSELLRDDVKYIGTGQDELPSNRDPRIGVQVDMHW